MSTAVLEPPRLRRRRRRSLEQFDRPTRNLWDRVGTVVPIDILKYSRGTVCPLLLDEFASRFWNTPQLELAATTAAPPPRRWSAASMPPR